jgi:LacI family transcriptional regulator
MKAILATHRFGVDVFKVLFLCIKELIMPGTIYDVADKAGVSISTVSRVLNKNPNVLEETRQKVLKVIEELDFKPSSMARNLVAKQSNVIQVLFSWVDKKCDFRNHWYVSILNGVNETVHENGYGLMVNTVAGIFDPQEIYEKVFRNAMDGMLVISPYLEDKDIARMNASLVPLVLLGHRIPNLQIDSVDSDNVGAAHQVIDHLVGLGHKRIGFISGPVKYNTDSADRLLGFQEAMKKHGLSIPAGYMVEGRFNKETGAEAAKKFLALSPRPTAIFSSDDLMAMGAWDEFEKAGLKVGKDISIVGFDDIPEASMEPYQLTTVKQDYYKMSVTGTNILIEKIKNSQGWKPRKVLIPVQLIIRNSVGKA